MATSDKLNTNFKITILIAMAIVSSCFLDSCKLVSAFVLMHRKNPKESKIVTGEKEIHFIPIVHYGQKVFYARLKDKVVNYKKEGFTVYYEQTINRFEKLNVSREQYDTIKRKYRKMTGGQGHSRQDYQGGLGSVFKRMCVQPLYDSLGIAATDVNADVTSIQMENEYERLYGKISLDSFDFKTPLDSPYACSKQKNSLKPVILDFRNRNLADMLERAPQHKIVVLYGKNHIKPVKKMIRKH